MAPYVEEMLSVRSIYIWLRYLWSLAVKTNIMIGTHADSLIAEALLRVGYRIRYGL